MGGADGSQPPTCSEGESIDGALVSPEATIEVMQLAWVCFPDMSSDAPVDVEISSPDGTVGEVRAALSSSMEATNSPIPVIDMTRSWSEPAGVYTVRAIQGENVITANVTVIEPDYPVVEVVPLEETTVEVHCAGFPPSRASSLYLYQQRDTSDSPYYLTRSVDFEGDIRGRASVHVSMPAPVSDFNQYGILTTPDATATGEGRGDAWGHLVFTWPS
jgi:hypothetical protein